jgi:hypothetical protein
MSTELALQSDLMQMKARKLLKVSDQMLIESSSGR